LRSGFRPSLSVGWWTARLNAPSAPGALCCRQLPSASLRVSRAVDSLVRAGLVERAADPDNRRRLCLRLTESGRQELASPPKANSDISSRLQRLAQSELRAVERAVEILER
jgi:hypothetical protein